MGVSQVMGDPQIIHGLETSKKEMDQSNSYNILGDEHAFCLFSKGSRVLTHTQIIPYIYMIQIPTVPRLGC